MPQPHGHVEPVKDREPIDAGVEKDAPQPGTAVGERRQRRALGASCGLEAAADQGSRSVSALATAPKTCCRPVVVSALPIRTSRCRWPAPQLRMKVESRVTTIAS